MMHKEDLHVLILAAGAGKRMHSAYPKVLHPVLFRPMICHVVDLASTLSKCSVSVVVGHGHEKVRELLTPLGELRFIEQVNPLGTGHAVREAFPLFSGVEGKILILSGDVILLRNETVKAFLKNHDETNAVCSILTTDMPDARGYGRIIRNGSDLVAIREERDCDEKQRKILEVNCGVYCCDINSLFNNLSSIGNQNSQQEFYLTDMVELLLSQKKKVIPFKISDFQEALGINDRVGLACVEKILKQRINERWMSSGVTLRDPSTTSIDPLSKIGVDSDIEGGCSIVDSEIAGGVIIESGVRLIGSKVAAGVILKQGSYIEFSDIGSECSVGPYAHLRRGSKLERKVKIGNFVEIKKSLIGEGTKASHLSYIGDAEIGRRVNLGCGFITCNYDGGAQKHKTTIEDEVFVGSDTQIVAPLRLGARSYVASGSTITKDVPKDSLAFARAHQVNKPNYAKRYQSKKDSREQ